MIASEDVTSISPKYIRAVMRHGMYPDVRLHLPSARSESRQVHLIRCDFLELLRKLGHDLSPGGLGENIMAGSIWSV
jgi:hypothetical protein